MLHSDSYVSEAIRKQKLRSALIMNSIELQQRAKKKFDEKMLKQKENQEWIILVIECLKEVFAEEPENFSRLEEELFKHWGRYQAWSRTTANNPLQEVTQIYFLRTFSYLHTDIQRMQGIWPDEMLFRVLGIVEGVYQKYSECTGKNVVIIRS